MVESIQGMSSIACPICEAELDSVSARPGEPVDCAACGQSFLRDLSGATLEPNPSDSFASRSLVPGSATAGEKVSWGVDAPLGRTGVLAAVLTLVFYGVLVMPLADTTFGELFGARGWVPYVISFLSMWSAVVLGWKYRELIRQSKVLDLDLLPISIAERITTLNAPEFIQHLNALSGARVQGFLVARLLQGLEHFQLRGDVGETVDHLRMQSEREAALVESSFTMLRVFIWAIPILGFIGTVIGIGQAVGGFSESVSAAADLDVMKDSIGSVTSGLGVAFDTTLLALVMSIFIMFPTSSLEKAEEALLGQVDESVQKTLIARLDDQRGTAADGSEQDLADRLADRLASQLLAALERRPQGAR